MSTVPSYQYLEPRLNSAYRQLFITGTRIRTEVVYLAHINAEEPMTAEQVAADFRLPLEAVLEAIAYCRANPPEIAADRAEEEVLLSARGQSDPNYKYDASPRILAPKDLSRLSGR